MIANPYSISAASLTYMATIKYKEPKILLIFQICISQNPVMCIQGWFSKSGHICKIIKKQVSIEFMIIP